MTAPTLKAAAVSYARDFGLTITPLFPQGKIPATKHGFTRGSNDPEHLAYGWDIIPNLNVGAPMGQPQGGIICIDIDKDDDKGFDGYDFLREWEIENGELPETVSAITGRGGLHLFYRANEYLPGSVNGEIHIDIRGDGDGVMLSPSIHPNGHRVEWENYPEEYEFAPVDDHVMAFINAVRPVAFNEENARFVLPDVIPDGTRDDTIYRYGCSLRAKGHDDDEIYIKMHEANVERCKPPLSKHQVDKKYNQVLKKPKGLSEQFKEQCQNKTDNSGNQSQGSPDNSENACQSENGNLGNQDQNKTGNSGTINDEITHLDFSKTPQLKPALIDGVMRQGGVLMLGGASKAGKTFMLIELALALSMGREWLGMECKESRVLYINLEVDAAEFTDRLFRVFNSIYEGEEARQKVTENIGIMNLRGKIQGMEDLVDRLSRELTHDYEVVIVDPSYKVIDGDENLARDVHKFTNELDRLATNLNASVVYCHHHSKGFKGDTGRMDRTSGSGVFARHADALIDCIELEVDEDTRKNLRIGDSSCFRLQFTTRSFKRPPDVDTVFSFPKHVVFENGELDECEPASPSKKGSQRGHETQTENANQNAYNTEQAAIKEINKHGKVKVSDLAKILDVDRKTVIAHIDKSEILEKKKEGNAWVVEYVPEPLIY